MPNHTKRHLHYKNMGYDDEISRHARKIGRPYTSCDVHGGFMMRLPLLKSRLSEAEIMLPPASPWCHRR